MSEATVRAALKTIVSGVTGTGLVYDYERWANEWPAFLALFQNVDKINGWTITCRGMQQQPHPAFPGWESGKSIVLRRYTYKIRGFYGLDDSAATEKTFMAIVEDVVEALDKSNTLHRETPDDRFEPVPYANLDIFEPRVFGGVLCHYAEITQVVSEQVVLTRS